MQETSFKYQWKWAWRFAKPYRYQLLLYFLLEVVSLTLGLLFIWWSKRTIDFAVTADTPQMKEALIFAVCSVVLGVGIGLYSGWLNERTRTLMLIRLQKDVIRTQMQATWGLVKNWHTGDIMVRVNTDCQEVVQVIGNSAIASLVTVLRILAATGFLWWMDPMLAVLLLAICPLIVFSKVYFRRFRKLNQHLKQAESNLGNVVQENLRFRLSIRALNLGALRWRKVDESQDAIYQMKMGVLNFSTVSRGLMNVVVNTGFLVTFAWGVYKLHAGAITFGTLSAFLQLVSRIQGPVLVLMGFVPLFVRFRASLDRLNEILLTEQEEQVAPEYLANIGQIELQGLSFRYEDKEVLNDLQATFVKGRPTAIVGASGKGKTTLIRLLLSLLRPNKGNIWIDSNGHRVLLERKHRVNFAYVPQGDKLFSGTIRENLQITESPISEERMRVALTTACALFVYDLPDGLDTVVGESGHGLSEGQAQRIAVARTLLRDCNVWLFDEVTSALDPPTAAALTAQLLEAGKEKILVFVTHDLALADACSQTILIR
ncbi:ABC transporter ATP-binding protein [Sphingobacterium suaedae]|uniref:ABC transporter ATP-binding protein n=1 Tax=Sphingobacterium suaedae TaxID=1686402 RepID=A0ABW5KM93_9SPHI